MRTATVHPIQPAQQRKILAEAGFSPRPEPLTFAPRCFVYGDVADTIAAVAQGIEERGGTLAFKPARDEQGRAIGVIVGELVTE